MREVKIISHNVYQIPAYIVMYFQICERSNPSGKDCKNQRARYELLKELAKNYDICCLQEVWGGNQQILCRELNEKYNIPEVYQSSNGYFSSNYLANIYNSYNCFIKNKTGGLYFACKKELPIVWTHHHRFENDENEKIVNKSISFSLLDMDKYWPGKYLLVGNVHIHSSDPHEDSQMRINQYNEISELLKKLPKIKLFPLEFSWDKCGFILGGDFNASLFNRNEDGVRGEYHKILKIMGEYSLIDIVNKELIPQRRTFSFKNGYVSPCSFHDAGIIDYMFTANNYITGEPLLELDIKHSKVIVPKKGYETSDHYALECKISPKMNQQI